MIKKKQKILLFFLFAFSIYCALTISQSWDEEAHLIQGKTTLDYLFSLGKIENEKTHILSKTVKKHIICYL